MLLLGSSLVVMRRNHRINNNSGETIHHRDNEIPLPSPQGEKEEEVGQQAEDDRIVGKNRRRKSGRSSQQQRPNGRARSFRWRLVRLVVVLVVAVAIFLVSLLLLMSRTSSPLRTAGSNDKETSSTKTTMMIMIPGRTANRDDAVDDAQGKKKKKKKNLAPVTATTAATTAAAAAAVKVRILAFCFPQFHRDDLNDRLWGDNFTDWDSVRAAPIYNRMGDTILRPISSNDEDESSSSLGYYDYTDIAPRRRHGELVKQYGLDGLVYHHYWFYDPHDHPQPRPHLHAPLEAMLRDGEPNVPFALHWCNSKWTSTWNGPQTKLRTDFVFTEPGVLQKQYYPVDDLDNNDPDIVTHYQWLRRFFHHPKYIKIHGRPLFMLYVRKLGSFRVLQKLRQLAEADGFPHGGLYISVGLTKNHPHLLPIDDLKQFPVPPMRINGPTKDHFDRVLAYPNPTAWNTNRTMTVPRECRTHGGGNMERLMDIPGIISSFDNTPRRNSTEATIWSRPDTSVAMFRTSLAAALYYESCCLVVPSPSPTDNDQIDDDRLIVINAMNEWAEGMALEPSNVYGRRFLETIRDVKQRQEDHQCDGGNGNGRWHSQNFHDT